MVLHFVEYWYVETGNRASSNLAHHVHSLKGFCTSGPSECIKITMLALLKTVILTDTWRTCPACQIYQHTQVHTTPLQGCYAIHLYSRSKFGPLFTVFMQVIMAQWSMHFKTTHLARNMWSLIEGGLKS